MNCQRLTEAFPDLENIDPDAFKLRYRETPHPLIAIAGIMGLGVWGHEARYSTIQKEALFFKMLFNWLQVCNSFVNNK